MVASFSSIVGWILAVVLTLASLEQSEAQRWTETPRDPFIVVEDGVNNTKPNLVWKFSVDETQIVSVGLFRKSQGKNDEIPIASRVGEGGGGSTPFTLSDENLSSKYNPLVPATLQLLNVKNGEEYEYTIRVIYRVQGGSKNADNSVFVDVKVPPKITTPPVSNVRRGRGSNVTLTCDVSGDPLPNITWTREGATTNQLKNATGPILHLVRIQLDDAGSYRCTADNGYGVVTSLASVNIICTFECNTTKVGITITNGAVWNRDLTNANSRYYKELVSNLTAAVSSLFSRPENAGKRPYDISVERFSSGSVRAFLDLEFPSTLSDPLKPLRDAVEITGTLGEFTVAKNLEVNPTTGPPSSTTDPTKNTQKEPSVGARSGLSPEAMWGIIGACIAIVVVVVVIIVVCCICGRGRCCACRKGSGASKGKYTEADGYRMNKQPPSSGLGTASPAYVEARMYAPPNATKKQDDQPPPLNYNELSFEKSDKQPPPRYNPEYDDVASEKRPPPSGGQQGEGGFELWC